MITVEQKIIDLENENSFLKDVLREKQKEIEEKNVAINKMSKDISRQLEEIEEKRIIIFAGAEKVKQLEKGNRSLMESRKKWKDRYYKEKSKNKTLEELLPGNLYELYLYYKELASKYQANSISKDEVREKIKELSKAQDFKVGLENYTIKILKELLEEK